MGAAGVEIPATQGALHWTKRHPEWIVRGTKHYNARLVESQILEMRKRRAAGQTIASIARLFGISKTHAGNIVNGRKWEWVK